MSLSARSRHPQGTVEAHVVLGCDARGGCAPPLAYMDRDFDGLKAEREAEGWRFDVFPVATRERFLNAYCPQHLAPSDRDATAVLMESYTP